MISGSDDRIAFVIDTEARLDGIRNARSEVRGLGTDSQASAQRMSQASQSQAQSVAAVANMSGKSRAAFEALDNQGKKAMLSILGVSEAEQKAVLAASDHAKAVAASTQAMGLQAASAEKSAVALLRARDAQVAAAAAAAAAPMLGPPLPPGWGGGGPSGPMLGPALPPGGIIPPKTEEQLKRIAPQARTAANAFSMLSNAALTGDGSMRGMVIAAGSLSTSMAMLSKSATMAAAASGIGAIVVVAGTAAMALYNMGKSAQVSQAQLDNLKNFSAANVLTNLAAIRKARNQAIEDAVEAADAGYFTRLGKMLTANLATKEGRALLAGGGADFSALDKANQLNEAATKITLEKLKAERLRVLAMTDQMNLQIAINARQIEGQTGAMGILDVIGRQTYELYTQEDLEAKRIKANFVVRDANGHILALTGAQTRQMNTLLEQNVKLTDLQAKQILQAKELADEAYKRTTAGGDATTSGNAFERYQDRIAQIEAEAQADIKAGRDREDVEARTAQRIRAIRKEIAKQAMDDARNITSVLIDSGSKQVKAVGHAADTIRRVVIGAQAAHAAVESAIEAGKAIGSLASMDWRGAALHGAAALELAKAAALGAQESLGGGRGASGGGGAGSGGGSTFEPRQSTTGQGMAVINLYSQNPYGPELIQQVKYQLERADVMKRPGIEIPPTTGIRAA